MNSDTLLYYYEADFTPLLVNPSEIADTMALILVAHGLFHQAWGGSSLGSANEEDSLSAGPLPETNEENVSTSD